MSLKFLGSLGFLRCLGTLGLLGAIASCTSHTGEGEMEPAAIGFHTHRIEEVGTRALISTTEDLRMPGFGVYGDKTVGKSSPQLVFDNIKVSGTLWDYKPTKYWDRTAAYRFVAYAPWVRSGTSYISYDPENKKLTINGILQWQKIDGDEIDYLVATSANTAETYISAYGGTVSLAFQHILAQLTVSVYKISPTTDYTINSLSITSEDGVPITADRSYIYDADTPASTAFSTPTTYGSQTLLSTDKSVGTTPTELSRHLVVPFNLGTGKNMALQLAYTVAGTKKTADVPIGISQFDSNSSYVFNLCFEAGNSIKVSVVEVKGWETIEVTDEVYNW